MKRCCKFCRRRKQKDDDLDFYEEPEYPEFQPYTMETMVGLTKGAQFYLSDFHLGHTIGQGSFGRVRAASILDRRDVVFALKIYIKYDCVAKRQVEHIAICVRGGAI